MESSKELAEDSFIAMRNGALEGELALKDIQQVVMDDMGITNIQENTDITIGIVRRLLADGDISTIQYNPLSKEYETWEEGIEKIIQKIEHQFSLADPINVGFTIYFVNKRDYEK